MKLQPGDLVRLHTDPPDSNVGKVQSVSDGGTVRLKSALHGHRCWNHDDLALVKRPQQPPSPTS